MNKKILLLVTLVLVGGAVAAVMISRPGDNDEGEGSASDPVGVGAPPASFGAPAPPAAQPSAGKPAGASVKRAEATSLTEAQKTTIVGLCRQAGKAYVEGKYPDALRLANEALDMDPNNQVAAQIAGTAACALKMQSNAQAMFNRLPAGSPQRRLLVRVCTRHGVQLAAGPPPASGPSPTAATAPGAPGSAAPGSPEAKASPKKPSSTATVATIRKARKSIVGCMKDHKGLVQVRMTVEGSGKVAAAAIKGKHASTEVGACVQKEVLKLTFPPFDGPPRTFIFPFIAK